MDLELVKCLNSDLTWKAVKKGHRSKKRRPRRPGASSSKFGFGSSNKKQESIIFEYEKSGVAILGQHFADEVLDVPIKKRILMLHPQSSSLHHEESELLVGSKHASGEQNGSNNTEQLRPIEKNVPDLNDFSGIELLAAAACHTSVSALEQHTTITPRVDSYTDGVKDDTALMDSDDSSVPDSTFSATKSVPSKDVRLHWDLNTIMDHWEEPCCDILVDPHSEKNYLKDVLQNPKGDDAVCVNQSVPLTKPETFTIQENTYDVVEDIAISDGARQAVSEVVQDDKLTSEDRLSDCCGSIQRNSVNKAKTGYDSPVEDGELRDASKYEVEEMECVDYESDNIYEDNFETISASGTEVTESINNIEKDDKTDVVPNRQNHLEHSQHAISQEKNDENLRKFIPTRKNMNDDRLTSFVRKNESCIRRSRSDNFGDSYSRTERDFGQKFMGRARNDWDSRNSHRYNTHQPINYNPRGTTYKTFNTRPSPSDRNESYGRFHLQGSRRGRAPQDEYNNHDHPKVTSFSPSFNRGAHSRSRRSRSRSESPIAWHFQKKRNVDTKETLDYRSSDTRLQQERSSFRKSGEIKSRSFEAHGYIERSRFPQGTRPNNKDSIIHDDRYGMMNAGGRFRYSVNTRNNKDNGFRYTRNENRCFKDPVDFTTPFRDGDFHKD